MVGSALKSSKITKAARFLAFLTLWGCAEKSGSMALQTTNAEDKGNGTGRKCPDGTRGELKNLSFKSEADGKTFSEDEIQVTNTPDHIDCGATASVLLSKRDNNKLEEVAQKSFTFEFSGEFLLLPGYFISDAQLSMTFFRSGVTGTGKLTTELGAESTSSGVPLRSSLDASGLQTHGSRFASDENVRREQCEKRVESAKIPIRYDFSVPIILESTIRTIEAGQVKTSEFSEEEKQDRGFALDSIDLRINVSPCPVPE